MKPTWMPKSTDDEKRCPETCQNHHQHITKMATKIHEKSRLRSWIVFGTALGPKGGARTRNFRAILGTIFDQKSPKPWKYHQNGSQSRCQIDEKSRYRFKSVFGRALGIQKPHRLLCARSFWRPFGDHFQPKVTKKTSKKACEIPCRKSIEK